MENLFLVLMNEYGPNQWSFNGENTYDNLVWHGPSEKPSLEYLESIASRIELENANRDLEALRLSAYRNESDPIFFKWQRGEASEENWLEKIAEIKSRFPEVTDQ